MMQMHAQPITAIPLNYANMSPSAATTTTLAQLIAATVPLDAPMPPFPATMETCAQTTFAATAPDATTLMFQIAIGALEFIITPVPTLTRVFLKSAIQAHQTPAKSLLWCATMQILAQLTAACNLLMALLLAPLMRSHATTVTLAILNLAAPQTASASLLQWCVMTTTFALPISVQMSVELLSANLLPYHATTPTLAIPKAAMLELALRSPLFAMTTIFVQTTAALPLVQLPNACSSQICATTATLVTHKAAALWMDLAKQTQ
jgi:hypothetical protein